MADTDNPKHVDGSEGNEVETKALLLEMFQKMDAKWEKKFEELAAQNSRRQDGGGKSRSHKRDREMDSDSDSENPKEKRAKTSQHNLEDEDVLVISDKLDDDEDKLCYSSDEEIQFKCDSESDLIKEIENDYNDNDESAEPIRDDIAKLCEGRFKNKLNEENLKKRKEAHKRPANCPSLIVPTVNKEIWSQLPNHARRSDVKMAAIQRNIVCAASAVATLVDSITKDKGSSANVRKGTDAIALLGHAAQDISTKRRAAVKPYVNKSVSRMCDDSSNIPVTDKLFGDNLASTVKDMKELDKLGASVSTDDKRFAGKKSSFLGGQFKNRNQYANGYKQYNSGNNKGKNFIKKRAPFQFGKNNRYNNSNGNNSSNNSYNNYTK